VSGKVDAVWSVVAKYIDSGTQESDHVLAAAEVVVGRLVVFVASALTRDDAAGMAMMIAVAEPDEGTDVGPLLTAVSAERTKASSRQD
jgi:hypothetical protein